MNKKFKLCFTNIKQRCNNKNYNKFKYYGWRWIKCEWSSFEEFKNDMYESFLTHCKEFWEKQTTIDRIDVNWNYCKNNCRWATFIEQNNNKRNNTKVPIKLIYDIKNNIKNIINKRIILILWKRYNSILEASKFLWITHQALSNRILYWKQKHIWQYNLNWELIKIWYSLSCIKKYLWYNRQSIKKTIEENDYYKWYKWKYIEDKNILYYINK